MLPIHYIIYSNFNGQEPIRYLKKTIGGIQDENQAEHPVFKVSKPSANIPVIRHAIKAFAEQANPSLETVNGILTALEEARSPLFTTRGLDHSGLGFTVMENFMASVSVRSRHHCGRGTTVVLKKKLEINGV